MSIKFKVAVLSDSMAVSNSDLKDNPQSFIHGNNLQHAKPSAPYKVSELFREHGYTSTVFNYFSQWEQQDIIDTLVKYSEGYPLIIAYSVTLNNGDQYLNKLEDFTKDIPKPMLQIKGKPILEYIVESFKHQGFYKFIICLNHKKEIIQEYFKDGKALGVEIEYLIEDKKLGTAGALSLLKKKKFKEPFFVINGDIISNLDYQSMLNFYLLNNADAIMCTKEESYTNPFAEVTFDEHQNLIALKEKPTTTFNINLGVYLLNSSMLPLLPINEYYDMPNLFIKAKEESLKVKVFSVNEDWIDIGKPVDYLRIKND